MQLAYNTLCRLSELVAPRIDDVVATPQSGEMRYSILLRKNKVGQEVRGCYLPMQAQTMFAIEQEIITAKLIEEPFL